MPVVSASCSHLLVFDSSADTVTVAVGIGARVHARAEAGGPAASTTLIPAIEAALGAAGTSLKQLDAIAFCAGPGSFTGVRTAAAVAQGMALVSGTPVFALDTLELIAREAFRRTDASWVAAVIDARMNEVYYAVFRRIGADLQTVLPAAVGAVETARVDMTRACPEAALVVAGQPGLIAAAAWRPMSALDLRIDAEALLRGARAACAAGPGVEPRDALPIYVRNKVALTTAEREARAALAVQV